MLEPTTIPMEVVEVVEVGVDGEDTGAGDACTTVVTGA